MPVAASMTKVNEVAVGTAGDLDHQIAVLHEYPVGPDIARMADIDAHKPGRARDFDTFRRGRRCAMSPLRDLAEEAHDVTPSLAM